MENANPYDPPHAAEAGVEPRSSQWGLVPTILNCVGGRQAVYYTVDHHRRSSSGSGRTWPCCAGKGSLTNAFIGAADPVWFEMVHRWRPPGDASRSVHKHESRLDQLRHALRR
jgi:hypothetical protein